MLSRPHSFDEIVGHTPYVELFKDHIEHNTLPHFIILCGAEGLGKTSLANLIAINLNYGFGNSPEKEKAIQNVIDKDLSIDCIKKYNMAKDSGKDTAREVLSEFSSVLSSTGKKVIICDECHAMSEAAQDVFLVDTEFIKDGTYLIMCTTNKEKLKPTLLSRAVVFTLRALKQSDMIQVLERVCEERNLNVQKGVLKMIAEWSDNKPRAALNVLNAFRDGKSVSNDMVRELIGYLKLDEVLPLLTTLSSSMTMGLSIISEMQIPDNMVELIVEAIRVKDGKPSYRLSPSEYKDARMQLNMVSIETLLKFLHKVASYQPLTRSGLIAAYTYAHVSFEKLMTKSYNIKQEELSQKLANQELAPDVSFQKKGVAPTLEDLLADSSFIED